MPNRRRCLVLPRTRGRLPPLRERWPNGTKSDARNWTSMGNSSRPPGPDAPRNRNRRPARSSRHPPRSRTDARPLLSRRRQRGNTVFQSFFMSTMVQPPFFARGMTFSAEAKSDHEPLTMKVYGLRRCQDTWRCPRFGVPCVPNSCHYAPISPDQRHPGEHQGGKAGRDRPDAASGGLLRAEG